ncbi:MAG: EamA family transporter [Prochlorococcaceae cyanobacterium]
MSIAAAAGVGAALAAALCWTLASSLWRGWPGGLDPARLNLLKNGLALALLLPLAVLLPGWPGAKGLALLALSGVVGIAAGDTLFLAALRQLGTRRTLTIDAGGPALTTLGGLLWLGERPALAQGLGIVLIALAVLEVARQRPAAGRLGTPPAAGLGPLLALGALVCGSAGALLARSAWLLGEIEPVHAAVVRLAAAALVLLPLLRGWPRGPAHRPGAGPRAWPRLLLATLLGTALGIVLQQAALARLGSGPAQALMATAPLMALSLARLEGDRPGWSGWLAAILGLAGVSLVAG